MADFSSTQQALVDAGTPEQVDPADVSGGNQSMLITATTPTGFAQDEVCTVWTPPKGYKWSGGVMSFEAMGASVTCVVGITGDTDKFMASVDVSAEGSANMNHTDGMDYEFDGSTAIIATFGGGNPNDAADLAWKMDFIGSVI